MGEMRNAYDILAEKPEEKRDLGDRHRPESNIKMDPKEIGFKGLNWIQLNKTVFFILTIVRT
jgi:hypothetical protein